MSAWLLTHDLDMKMPAGMIDPGEAADLITSQAAEIERLKASDAIPAAYRVKDFADGWIICRTFAQAQREADGADNLIEPLYAASALTSEHSARVRAEALLALMAACAERGECDANYNAMSMGFWERQHISATSRAEAAEERIRALETEVLDAAFSDRLDDAGSPLTWREIAEAAEAKRDTARKQLNSEYYRRKGAEARAGRLAPQPIETAPKDDEPVILASSAGRVWFQAMWDDEDERWVTFNRYLESDKHQTEAWVPTLWIPLPALASTLQDVGGEDQGAIPGQEQAASDGQGDPALADIEPRSDGPFFTVVFAGDIRDLQFNPMTATSPFGKVVACGIGNAFDEVEDLISHNSDGGRG